MEGGSLCGGSRATLHCPCRLGFPSGVCCPSCPCYPCCSLCLSCPADCVHAGLAEASQPDRKVPGLAGLQSPHRHYQRPLRLYRGNAPALLCLRVCLCQASCACSYLSLVVYVCAQGGFFTSFCACLCCPAPPSAALPLLSLLLPSTVFSCAYGCLILVLILITCPLLDRCSTVAPPGCPLIGRLLPFVPIHWLVSGRRPQMVRLLSLYERAAIGGPGSICGGRSCCCPAAVFSTLSLLLCLPPPLLWVFHDEGELERMGLYVCVCVYVYVCMCVCVCVSSLPFMVCSHLHSSSRTALWRT